MMYTDKSAFINKLKTGKIPGVILWQGASAIDGAPIVLVANKFDGDSQNQKTGSQVQTWILPDPRAAGIECNGSRPAKIMAWLKSTGAKSICGDCPHAWQYNEKTGKYEKGSCYVREYQAPAATLGGVYRGAYPIAGIDFPRAWIWELGYKRDIRAGSYGDPAACPPDVWADFLSMASTRTGYTHGWKSAHAGFKRNAWRMRDLLMASCDSAADLHAARDAGFRCFYVVPTDSIDLSRSLLSVGAHIDGAMICPASDEFEQIAGRKTQCAKCGACSGAGGKAARMPDVFIPAHGATGGRIQDGAQCPAAARMLERMGA